VKYFIKNKKRPFESGTVYVVGTGPFIEDLKQIPEGADIFGANDAANSNCKYMGTLDHSQVRDSSWFYEGVIKFSRFAHRGVDFVVRTKPGNLTSGIYCAYVAHLLGYDDIRLVNIPITGHYYKEASGNIRLLPDSIKEKISSYSGWTKEYFGAAKTVGNP